MRCTVGLGFHPLRRIGHPLRHRAYPQVSLFRWPDLFSTPQLAGLANLHWVLVVYLFNSIVKVQLILCENLSTAYTYSAAALFRLRPSRIKALAYTAVISHFILFRSAAPPANSQPFLTLWPIGIWIIYSSSVSSSVWYWKDFVVEMTGFEPVSTTVHFGFKPCRTPIASPGIESSK